MEDNKEMLKEEQLEDVNGGIIIVTCTGDADKAGDGLLPLGEMKTLRWEFSAEKN